MILVVVVAFVLVGAGYCCRRSLLRRRASICKRRVASSRQRCKNIAKEGERHREGEGGAKKGMAGYTEFGRSVDMLFA